MQTNNNLKQEIILKLYVGVDVSKDKIDIIFYIKKKRYHYKFDNKKSGFVNLNTLLKKRFNVKKVIIAMESTGHYHINLADYCVYNKYDVYILNPKKVKDFISSMYEMKTDKNDSKAILEYLEIKERNNNLETIKDRDKINKYIKLSDVERKLKVLSQERARVIKLRKIEKTRIQMGVSAEEKIRNRQIKRRITFYNKELELIEKQIKDVIKNNKITKEKYKLLNEIPGVGFVTAIGFIALTSELGKISNKKISSLVGVAPHPNESGKMKKRSKIHKGRKNMKVILYMAAINTIKHHPTLKPFYKKLVEEKGKPKKVAIIAVMRKLLVIANAKMRDYYLKEGK